MSDTPQPQPPRPRKPKLAIGQFVEHPQFGRGRVLDYEGDRYVVLFPGADVRKVAMTYEAMKPLDTRGNPEMDFLKMALREVLGDYGWIETETEMAPRWIGGTMRLIPGKEDTQSKDIPLDVFFKKIIGIREKLRVLEQKINHHPSLSWEDKAELEGYITRCYGSLTTFNILFASRESWFTGQSKD
ncbi:MAG: hypothetical protein NTW86_02785 [Candidatus Sumerlaeota bacterium]|nr:hypothetical protein [Candidatus Sumerlaeota bacterium]